MSVHALTLTGYTTKRVQTCKSVAQTSSDVRPKAWAVPDLPLTKMPRMSTILFPAAELPRPAVIGLGGSNGSYLDSATAIKEILASVLNIQSPVKSAVNMDVQDSDVDNCAENRNDKMGCDPDCAPSSSQLDIRLTRNKAAWDNSQLDPSITFAAEPTTTSYNNPTKRSENRRAEMGLSPFLKCDRCTELILKGPNASQVNVPLRSQKDRRFSYPNLSSLHSNLLPNLHQPPSEQNLIPLLAATVDTEQFSVEDRKTFHRRSKSYSNIPKEAENSVTSSTEHLPYTDENLFEPAVNLEKENEHFLAAELFISVVEKMKSSWQYEQWMTEGGMYWMNRDEPGFHRKKANSESAVSVDSGYEGLPAMQNSPAETIIEEETGEEEEETGEEEEETGEEEEEETEVEEDEETEEEEEVESKHSIETSVFINFDEYVIIELEDYEKLCSDMTDRPLPQDNSAEQTAKSLYRAFRQQWMQVDEESELPNRITANLQVVNHVIAEEFESSVNLVEEIKKIRMRDTEEWSPRFQIITTVHPYVKRDEIVASQNYLCAGCGTKVEPRYTNRLRYCEYLGKYFCDCCHSYTESFIPGRILSKWSFGKYYVSNFAKSVVDRIWDSHQFNVQTENPELYKKVKDLNRVREVQEQLIYIRKLVSTCRFNEGIMEAFETVPSHLTEKLHLFTLSDLYNVKQKTLLPSLRELMATIVAHVDQCELCQAKGFICEFCQHADVIFPFQSDTCCRCEVCKACYHKQCFKTRECPKCARIKAREALRTDSPFTSSGEMESSFSQ